MSLWEHAREHFLHHHPRGRAAAIVSRPWFQTLLRASGFTLHSRIVLLERESLFVPPAFTPRDFNIRPMRAEDLPAVTQIDLQAFGAFWHNTQDTLERAYSLAARATVAENESEMLGYQISTGSPHGIHLARLAVLPGWQGRGIGAALVSEAMRFTMPARVTVNTQEENSGSLALYKKLGFCRTGESLPVMSYSV